MYKTDFFEQYHAYLELPDVKTAHDRVFSLFARMLTNERIVDLGCGTCEFARFMKSFFMDNKYVGVDLDITNARIPLGVDASLRQGDMNNYSLKDNDAFVSLFASELFFDSLDLEDLYEKWFFQGAKIGLVSGFYYVGNEHYDKITENTGMTVFQTQPSRPMLNEIRILQSVPAGMFEKPFIEVWRILRC